MNMEDLAYKNKCHNYSGRISFLLKCPLQIQGHFFDEYAMEGVSPEANEIYLELSPENLLKALKTAQNAKWIKIKLTKKHAPCLTVEVDLVRLTYVFDMCSKLYAWSMKFHKHFQHSFYNCFICQPLKNVLSFYAPGIEFWGI